MARFASEPLPPLLLSARRRLGHSQRSFGEMLGVSRRTAWRWEGGGSLPTDAQLAKLARALYTKDRDLTARIAAFMHETLESLGLEKPPPPPPPPSPPPRVAPPPSVLAEVVVCAAAEVLGSAPSSVRPLLRAAFERAVAVGLTAEEVAEALRV